MKQFVHIEKIRFMKNLTFKVIISKQSIKSISTGKIGKIGKPPTQKQRDAFVKKFVIPNILKAIRNIANPQ